MSGNLLKKYPLIFILSFAFLIRFLYFVFIALRNPDGIYVFDSYGYWQLADNLRNYGIFSQGYSFPLEPDYYRTPLYPLFIIISEAIGPEGFSIIFFQILLAVLTCYFTYRIAMNITASVFVSGLSALFLALDVPSVVMNSIVLTETLFTFLLVTAVHYFIHFLKSPSVKTIVLCAFLTGALILCRPIAFFLPFFFVVVIIINQRRQILKAIGWALVLSSVALLTISPWFIRNKITFGHYFLSVIREHNVQNYQAAAIYAKLHNRSLAESQSILRWKTFREFKGDANRQPFEYARYIESESVDLMLAHPKLLLEHHVSQFIYFFLKPCRAYIDIQLGNWGKGYNTIPKGYPIMKYLFEHNSKLTIAAVIFQLIMLLIMYLSMIFSFVYFKNQKGMLWFIVFALLIFCFANLTIPSITESRFRVPVMPFISILSAAGIYYLKERVSKRSLMKE